MLLVQVYVDDIIFGSTNEDLCKRFAKLMESKFAMSLVGELKYFLGLQVDQRIDGILSKKRYDLVIVDDYSKYTWVLFLHSKDETPQMVIDHLKLIELDSKFPVRAIRSDNGTEFKNQLLNDFCSDKGISRQYS